MEIYFRFCALKTLLDQPTFTCTRFPCLPCVLITKEFHSNRLYTCVHILFVYDEELKGDINFLRLFTSTHVCLLANQLKLQLYNSFLIYCRELAPGTVSLTGDWAQGDDSKHDSHYSRSEY